jgi:YVTN family beta-propeller protein
MSLTIDLYQCVARPDLASFFSGKSGEIPMKFRACGLLATAVFAAACILGSAQVLAQNLRSHAANSGGGTVSVMDTATNTVTAIVPVGLGPSAIQQGKPVLKFAGTPGQVNCYGQSVWMLTLQYGGLPAAAAALGFSSVQVLQNKIAEYCAG